MNAKLINYRFIALHTLAALLVLLGARELHQFFNAHFVEASYLYSNQTDKFFDHIAVHEGNSNDSQVIFNYFYGRLFSGLAGLLFSVLLSWLLSRKSGIHGVNVFLPGLLGFTLLVFIHRARFDSHHILNYFFDMYGAIGIKRVLLLHTIFLFSLSFFIFFNRKQKSLA